MKIEKSKPRRGGVELVSDNGRQRVYPIFTVRCVGGALNRIPNY